MDSRPERAVVALTRLAFGARSYLNKPMPVRHPGQVKPIAGQRILITGASSGIGRAAARELGRLNAAVLLVARREAELAWLHEEIVSAGGTAAYRVCDLADRGEVEALVRWTLDEHGGVDILVNNAGRSMRRPVTESFERLDDFHRAMEVNFFGPVHLTLGLLPAMLSRGSGQVINVGTWTIPVGTSPRFAAYHSSKTALAGFGRCVMAEVAGRGVQVTAVHYPLVHTAMSAPTGRYRDLPGLTPDEAAEWIVTAIRYRPASIAPRYVPGLRALGTVAPRAVDRILLRWG
ncbi:MAG: SDR family NAD(P)-dependent oxidoreductase [Actinomycetota bacterium]|nr:SDR family NAD(P)-dependent oxidoreductase [Actinomycetota bacterium]